MPMPVLMGLPVMISESPWVIERFGVRGARAALVTSGVLFIALLGIWAGIEIRAAWHAGHVLKGVLLGLVALLLLSLSLRILAVNWRATRPGEEPPVLSPDGNEQTGVWGVGGPSMREPGSTGVFLSRRSTDRD